MRLETAIKILKRLRLEVPLMADVFKAIDVAIRVMEKELKREKDEKKYRTADKEE